MNLNHYKSFFITEKYYTSIFKKKVKEDYNPEGIPEPAFTTKVQKKIKSAKVDIINAKMQSDIELAAYWTDFSNYLQDYLDNPDFGSVRKMANQKPDEGITKGRVDAAKFLMKLYKK